MPKTFHSFFKLEIPIRKRSTKKVILFSGGWDSVACAIMNPNSDLLFVNYGQIYYEKELLAAQLIAKELNKELIIKHFPLSHDIKNRNYFLVLFAQSLGYKEIILGIKNILPIFDKYKDSNLLSLKIASLIFNIKISLPIAFYTKKRIVNLVRSNIKNIPYNCYKNKQSSEFCDCSNCRELIKLGVKNEQNLL